MTKPVLQIIIGSTRPGRVGPTIANWFAQRAVEHGGFEVEVLDLADFGLPLLDEPNHPRMAKYTKDHTKRWSEAVSRGDAYVLCTPEYNYSMPASLKNSMPASLKNALDYLHNEWNDKAVAFLSYGGVSGGMRAVQALKHVANPLRMYTTQMNVMIPFVQTKLSDNNATFTSDDTVDQSVTATLDELLALSTALDSLRARV